MLLNTGTVLGGRYEIIEKIGSGGMAVVYRGRDQKLERYVTIKVLREEFIDDEEFIERFRSEACSAARLSHPNIVRVYDVGDDQGINYIVMEYIHGDTLKTAIKKKAPFDSRSTINVAIQIASALSQAHKAHIVHRDIKPQNILVGTDGVVKVTDFGIARAARVTTMTTTANAAGSVHYFSPEQARGGYVDEKSDIYSLGITMFEMITGELPFRGNNSVTIALKHINEELPDIKQYNPKCSKSLEGIIRKATMKKADERYASIDLLLSDLMRARTEMTMQQESLQTIKQTEHTEDMVNDFSRGVRMSKRAEAAMELKAAQEKQKQLEAERARRAAQMQQEQKQQEAVTTVSPLVSKTVQPENIPEETKRMDEKEIDFIQLKRKEERAEEPQTVSEEQKEEDMPLVSFQKYGKKLKLSKDDAYEGEYMAVEEVKKSKRPEKKRRNPRKEPEYDNDRDRNAERKVIMAAIATAVVIIVVISAVGLRALGGFRGFGSAEKTIAMPTLVGMTYQQAEQEAEKLGFKLQKEGEDYNSYYDKDYVFWQAIQPEAMVAPNTKIGVKVSLGLTSQTMPDVKNFSENDAKQEIIRLVGTTPNIKYEEDGEVKAGHVISQTPSKGDKIDANTNITLVVSKGGENSDTVVVPDVQNTSEREAVKSLKAVGLTVGNISYIESETVAKGNVITQTLSANEEVPSGSVVNLVVSSGAPKEEEPEKPTEQPTEKPQEQQNQQNGQTEPNQNNEQTTTPQPQETPQPPTSGTKYFTLHAPAGAGDTVHVQVTKTDVNGSATVMDVTKNLSDFPFSIAVTGAGEGNVTAYVDGAIAVSEQVNFSE